MARVGRHSESGGEEAFLGLRARAHNAGVRPTSELLQSYVRPRQAYVRPTSDLVQTKFRATSELLQTYFRATSELPQT